MRRIMSATCDHCGDEFKSHLFTITDEGSFCQGCVGNSGHTKNCRCEECRYQRFAQNCHSDEEFHAT